MINIKIYLSSIELFLLNNTRPFQLTHSLLLKRNEDHIRMYDEIFDKVTKEKEFKGKLKKFLPQHSAVFVYLDIPEEADIEDYYEGEKQK